jgi:hypothetical protein
VLEGPRLIVDLGQRVHGGALFSFLLVAAPGTDMRRLLGVPVFAGMLGVTLFGIFLTPVFFYVIQWLGDHLPAATIEDEKDWLAVEHVAPVSHNREALAPSHETATATSPRRPS